MCEFLTRCVCVCERENVCMCVRERESVCVCVCGGVGGGRECVCTRKSLQKICWQSVVAHWSMVP